MGKREERNRLDKAVAGAEKALREGRQEEVIAIFQAALNHALMVAVNRKGGKKRAGQRCEAI